MKKIIITLGCFVFLCSNICYAHPHGGLSVKANFIVANNKINEIRTEWILDEFNSMLEMGACFNPQSRKFVQCKPMDMEKTQSFFLQYFKEKNYLSIIRLNDNIYSTYKITKFNVDPGYGGKIVISYSINFTTPIDPLKTKVSASFYDPTYYYDVSFDKSNPIKFTGGYLTYKIIEDTAHSYYLNMVNPQMVIILGKG